MKLSEIFIERCVSHTPEALSIVQSFQIPASVVDQPKDVIRIIEAAEDPFQKAKEILFITRNKGAFIKPCPGTRSYICCGYTILNIGTYCTMDCAYCILQTYFHPPVLQYFANHDDMLDELTRLFKKKQLFRIGTGEFTDSMIWDEWMPLSEKLILTFSSQTHSMLELKTKTTHIEKLKDLDHKKKTVIAWSMNTERIIDTEERNTAPLQSRIAAAKQCETWGYPLAFHFDPMIIYEGCETDYDHVVELIFSSISHQNIIWISLGAFRFIPSLKPIIRRRFPDSKIIYGEFIQGLDNKMRYFKSLRIRLYRNILKKIKEIAPDVLVYLCMEDQEVWQKALGFSPSERGGLANMLNRNAIHFCELKIPM